MGFGESLTLLATATALALALALRRTRAQLRRARRGLDTAAQQLEHLQTSFTRFAPRDVVERIIAHGAATSAENREVTVLFADLVGFTRLSEQLQPRVLVDVLNGYFARMSRVVTDHRGHVAKFIGDGMLALFGALEPNPWHTSDAVRAALDMRAALAAYNHDLAARGLPALRFGVGIHRGVAVAGVIGSEELMDFTVIGGTVNLASRIERLTRSEGTDILVTGAVQDALDGRFRLRKLPPVTVRGLSQPVTPFAVLGFEP
jgi:adenylate cyclase